jgi:hypothetical protein
MRDGVVIRLRVPGQGFHDNVSFTGVFYGPAGDNSPGITVKNYFEHDVGGIGRSALHVVMKSGVEGAQVQPVNEVIKGMLERAIIREL